MKSQVRTHVKHKQIANETFAIVKETQRIRIYVCRKQLTQDAYKTQIDFVYFLRSPKNYILFLENKILFSWLRKKNTNKTQIEHKARSKTFGTSPERIQLMFALCLCFFCVVKKIRSYFVRNAQNKILFCVFAQNKILFF